MFEQPIQRGQRPAGTPHAHEWQVNGRRQVAGTKNMENKTRKILDQISAGRSYEQILANDRTLSYHDIFHVVTEAPTSFWKKASAKTTVPTNIPGDSANTPTTAKHRRD